MNKYLLLFVCCICTYSFSQSLAEPNYSYTSNLNFEPTIEKIKKALHQKNITIFAEIDHQQQAQKANLQLSKATLLIVGNPKVGTLLMQENVEFAIELPLKILVSEKGDKVYVSYKKITPLADEYQLNKHQKTIDLMKKIDHTMIDLIQNALTIVLLCN